MASSSEKFEPIDETLSREERIRRRAYELYLHRGGQHGYEQNDWLQAEAEEELPVDQEPTLKNGRF
jgi:hypothetical protein